MKRMLFTLCTGLLMTVAVQAQQEGGRLEIQLSKNVLQPGDSLSVTVHHTDSIARAGSLSLATVELMIENEQGQRTRLRWPVINGQASGTLYLPDSLPRGRYVLLAGLQERFFEVIGKIEEANIGRVRAMLLTKTGDWDEQEVAVGPDGTFAIRNWLFEDNALLAFSGTNNNKRPLNIRISTRLDSSASPLAVAGRAFYVGNPPSAAEPALSGPVEASGALFAGEGTELPAVIVRSTNKSRAQQYSDEYVRGMFQSGDGRLLSVMDDPSALGFQSILSYLQGRVAGLQVSSSGFNGGSARWRGSPVSFFLDEVRVPAQQVATLPMADIAIVKAFPPPFMGTQGGGGAIAIYTRRGGEAAYYPANRQVFRVRGYTPAAVALSLDRLSM
ncbi:MAG TPA: hypothetical protein VHK69_06200 [Chitinophagaceae bacterium]|jgi:hypothetical protein|nr:hypothetical protein [Chitinophagaceae bacterium]